ncbi:MAG: family 10 glycosylhydrolase [Clostridia bacterium]|nr:family 10 glycosylhydrolase [Clostridia bacterium]
MFAKRIICVLLSVVLIMLTACSGEDKNDNAQQSPPVTENISISGVWLTCYDLSKMLADGTETTYTEKVQEMLDKCMAQGLDTVFFQARPFADALYKSAYFPVSEYACSSSGKAPDFDPLEIFILLAHERNIEVHAWINPFRISYETSENKLPENCIAKNADYKDFVVYTSAGVYLDPSSLEAQSLVLSGVREILSGYSVDGIHIDDYFYPTTDKTFDEESYNNYRQSGGKLKLDKWRRENINALVSAIYDVVHSYSGVIFSISPCADIDKNRNQLYADVELWLKKDGYADLIIPQIYFGFEHESMPFETVAEKWAGLKRSDNVSLACGLAVYKQNAVDDLAGEGSGEWLKRNDIIERQKLSISSFGYCGYVLFSYADL